MQLIFQFLGRPFKSISPRGRPSGFFYIGQIPAFGALPRSLIKIAVNISISRTPISKYIIARSTLRLFLHWTDTCLWSVPALLDILKCLEIIHQYLFLSVRSHNIKSVKINKEKWGDTEIFLFRRRVWILIESSPFFLEVLKVPINPYFCPPGRIIFSRLKKVKKNKE